MRYIVMIIVGMGILGSGFYAGRITAPVPDPVVNIEGLTDLVPEDLIGAIEDETQRGKLLQVWSTFGPAVTDPDAVIGFGKEDEAPSPFPEGFPEAPFFGVKAASDGVEFPDIDLLMQENETLVAAKEGWVVMNMWASWCAPCIAELPDLAAAMEALGTDDVSIHVINADPTGKDTPESARAVMNEKDASSIPFLFVEGKRNISKFTSAVFEDPNTVSYPYTVIYAPGGVPYATFAGAPTDERKVWSSEKGLAFFRALPTLNP